MHYSLTRKVILFTFSIFISVICAAQTAVNETALIKQRADSLQDNAQYDKALAAYAELFEKIESPTEEKARAAFSIGQILTRLNERDKAIQHYEIAASIFKEIKKMDNHNITLARIANIKDDEGLYNEAIALSEQIVQYFVAQNDSISASKNFSDLALFQYHNGQIQQAVEGYSKALAWIGSHDASAKAKIFNQLGNIWADELKDENKALEYYRKSLALKTKDNATPQSISASYNNIGLSHKNIGNQDSALFNYNKALEYAIQSGMPKFKINPLTNIGNLYKKQEKYEEAIAILEEVMSLSEHMSVNQRVNTHLNLGHVYNESKQYRKALNHLLIVEELLETTNNLVDKSEVQGHKAQAYFGLNDFKNAYLSQVKYKQYADSMRTREREQEIADVMIKYEAAEKDNSLLEQEQLIQQQQLNIQRRTTLLVSIIACFVFLAGVVFFLFKKKQAAAKQAQLELKLAEQKEIARIQEERLRISRELHDNIGSYLTLINASVEQLPSLDKQELQNRLPEVQNNLAMSMRELRKTVWLLNKPKVTIEEIAIRLRDFFKPLHQNGTRITVQANGNTEQTLSEIQTTHLFRVIQEAVNNAYKYASSETIAIQLDAEQLGIVQFSITDDGNGFDTVNTDKGNGLYNMKSRMDELQGELVVNSIIDKGTVVNGKFKI